MVEGVHLKCCRGEGESNDFRRCPLRYADSNENFIVKYCKFALMEDIASLLVLAVDVRL